MSLLHLRFKVTKHKMAAFAVLWLISHYKGHIVEFMWHWFIVSMELIAASSYKSTNLRAILCDMCDVWCVMYVCLCGTGWHTALVTLAVCSKKPHSSEIWGSHDYAEADINLLGCYTLSTGKQLPRHFTGMWCLHIHDKTGHSDGRIELTYVCLSSFTKPTKHTHNI